jgi:hypothetical protein
VSVQWLLPLVVGIALAFGLAACGPLFQPGARGPAAAPPEYTDADAATIVFGLESVGCCYMEGAVRAVEVAGPVNAAWRIEDGSAARLPPGDYALTVYEQVCDGSCDWLGEPKNQCSLNVTVRPADQLRLDITYPLDEPCLIEQGSEAR